MGILRAEHVHCVVKVFDASHLLKPRLHLLNKEVFECGDAWDVAVKL